MSLLARRLAVIALVSTATVSLTAPAVAAADTTTTTGPTVPTTTSATASSTRTTSVAPASSRAASPTTTAATSTTSTAAALAAVAGGRPARAANSLHGVLALTNGACGGAVSGTYFRMLQPGGRPQGPASGYLINADSPCADKTYTPLSAGTDGGLALGTYQPEPSPAFDGHGNALAARIVEPSVFFGVRFSLATAPTDAQTGVGVPAPALTVDGDVVHGDVRALTASWNRGHFNQGAPKPDGSTPGLTTAPVGTYDPATGALTVEWTSSIVGGPFDGFTGEWHLAGHLSTVSTTSPGAAADPSPAAAVATPGAPAASGPNLATTGTQPGSALVVGLLLVAVGATTLLLAGPRRRRDAPLPPGPRT